MTESQDHDRPKLTPLLSPEEVSRQRALWDQRLQGLRWAAAQRIHDCRVESIESKWKTIGSMFGGVRTEQDNREIDEIRMKWAKIRRNVEESRSRQNCENARQVGQALESDSV